MTAAIRQAKELLHWTEKYEHAKHMLHRLKAWLNVYYKQKYYSKDDLQKAKLSLLQARAYLHAKHWTKVRNIAHERIKLHLRAYQRELAK